VLGPAAGGDEIRRWEAAGGLFDWAPTGDAVDFVRRIDGVLNLWRSPLVGGEPHQLTHFTTPSLESFTWSDDGSTLFYTRSMEATSDVVLITNFRPEAETP